MAVMGVQLHGLLAPELVALLPSSRLEMIISPYCCPPPNLRGPLGCQLAMWGEWVQASAPCIRVVLPRDNVFVNFCKLNIGVSLPLASLTK